MQELAAAVAAQVAYSQTASWGVVNHLLSHNSLTVQQALQTFWLLYWKGMSKGQPFSQKLNGWSAYLFSLHGVCRIFLSGFLTCLSVICLNEKNPEEQRINEYHHIPCRQCGFKKTRDNYFIVKTFSCHVSRTRYHTAFSLSFLEKRLSRQEWFIVRWYRIRTYWRDEAISIPPYEL